jgi:hypothetical protein
MSLSNITALKQSAVLAATPTTVVSSGAAALTLEQLNQSMADGGLMSVCYTWSNNAKVATTTPHITGLTANLAAPIKGGGYERVADLISGFDNQWGKSGTTYANTLLTAFLDGESDSIDNSTPMLFQVWGYSATQVNAKTGKPLKVRIAGTYFGDKDSEFTLTSLPKGTSAKKGCVENTPDNKLIGGITFYAPVTSKDGTTRMANVAEQLLISDFGYSILTTPVAQLNKWVAYMDVNAKLKGYIEATDAASLTMPH